MTPPWACDTPKAVKSAYFTLIAYCAIAQTVGLPQYGVLIEGTADAPVLINNSSHRVLAYALQYDNRGFSTYNMLGQFRTQPTSSGIAPGASNEIRTGSLQGTVPVGGGGAGRVPVPPQVRDASGLPVQHTSVALDAILFDDGHVLGPDKGGMFDRLASQIKGEQEVAAILLDATDRNSAWTQIQNIANSPPELPVLPRGGGFLGALPPGRPQFARQLLLQRSAGGEAAAIKLAAGTKNYPVIVKGE